MEQLLNRIQDAGMDPFSVNGEEAIILWNHVRLHIATNNQEKAACFAISSEHRFSMKQINESIEELRFALDLLALPHDAEYILEIRASLSERLLESGDFTGALNEYTLSTTIAVEHGFIDHYVMAVIGMGNLCEAYGDSGRALRFYQKIDGVDHAISSRALRLRYKLYMLYCFINLGRVKAATDLLAECEELSILVSDKHLTGQIYLYQSRLHRLQGQHQEALIALSKVQHSASDWHSLWLSAVARIEIAQGLNAIGKEYLSSYVISSAQRFIDLAPSAPTAKYYYDALSQICASQGDFENALKYEKKAFRVESDLVKHIPISELGQRQLRRLSRFELQLKLILSEIENKELKESTQQHIDKVAKLQQDVFTDPLTSLRNRRWLDIKLKELLLHETPFALMVIDIDHFKSINDELSHLVGDKAIQGVSSQISNYFRFKNASCVRFGGEEFLVILEKNNLGQAEMHAENLRERIDKFDWESVLGERRLTVSVGCTLHHDGENTQRTFYRADKALYRAKANGRNQVCIEQ